MTSLRDLRSERGILPAGLRPTKPPRSKPAHLPKVHPTTCRTCGALTKDGRTLYCEYHRPDPRRIGWNRGRRAAQSTKERGYGTAHETLRRQWQARLDQGEEVHCPRPWCGYGQILPSDDWHLGHTDDRTGYNGPEHAACNLRAASEAGRRRQA